MPGTSKTPIRKHHIKKSHALILSILAGVIGGVLLYCWRAEHLPVRGYWPRQAPTGMARLDPPPWTPPPDPIDALVTPPPLPPPHSASEAAEDAAIIQCRQECENTWYDGGAVITPSNPR